MNKFIFFVILCTFGCDGAVATHPTPIITDTNMCPTADTHLSQLCKADPVKNAYCCQIDAVTAKGKNFTQICTEKQNEGIWMNPKCLSTITACSQINVCTGASK